MAYCTNNSKVKDKQRCSMSLWVLETEKVLPCEWVSNTARWNHRFSAMKNRTTSNYAQTWVTKKVNHHVHLHWFVRRQSSAYRAKTRPTRKACERMLRHRDCAAVCIWRITWSSGRAARRKESAEYIGNIAVSADIYSSLWYAYPSCNHTGISRSK